MRSELEREADLTAIITLMSSIVSNFLLHRVMPSEYLAALVQHINAFLQEDDMAEEHSDGC